MGIQQTIGGLDCSYEEFIGGTVIVLFYSSSSNRIAPISAAYFANLLPSSVKKGMCVTNTYTLCSFVLLVLIIRFVCGSYMQML